MITKLALSLQQQQQQQQQHETNKDNDDTDTNTTDNFMSSNNSIDTIHSFFSTARNPATRREIVAHYVTAGAAAVTTSSVLDPLLGRTTIPCWAQEVKEEVRLLAATCEQLDVVVQACSVQAWNDAEELVRGIDLMGLHKLVQNNTTFLVDSGNNNDIDLAVTGIGVLRTQLAAATTTPHTTVTNDDAIQIMTIGTDSRAALERFMVSRSNNNYDEDGVDE